MNLSKLLPVEGEQQQADRALLEEPTEGPVLSPADEADVPNTNR